MDNVRNGIIKSALYACYRVANRIRRFYWFACRPRRYGVKVLVVDGDAVLLVRHSYSNRWNLPGGGFSPKRESVIAAAARELREEVGLSAESIDVLGSFQSELEYKRDTVYCVFATVRARRVRLSAEIREASWFRRDGMPTDLSTAVAKAMEMAQSKMPRFL